MKKKLLLILLSACCFPIVVFAQISGKVFRDLNNDGIQQIAEPNLAGVIVNAYDGSNTILTSATTLANGTYTMPYTVPVRVEFELPVSLLCIFQIRDYCGKEPLGNNVRFINSSTSNLDFAVQNAEDFNVTPNPLVYVSRFNRGNPLILNSPADTFKAVFGYPHTTSGSIFSTPSLIPNSVRTGLVGSVWGMAYSKHAKKIFCSAFLKRHSGLGPLGTGGIYMLEPTATSFNVTNFYDLDANGYRTRAASTAVPFGLGSSFNITGVTTINYLGPTDPLSGAPEGLGVVGSNSARGLLGTINYVRDSSVFDQVCKVGLGDMEISDDGRYIFVMNLYSRHIMRMELDNVANPTTFVKVDTFPMPNFSVNNGVLRPFALRYHRDKLYIGAVSSGENGGQNNIGGITDLYAYVFEMNDPLTTTPTINPTPFYSVPLNYKKGATSITSPASLWHPWTNSTSIPVTSENGYPCPVLSEIDFKETGDLILAFTDRTGHQFGYSYGAPKNLAGTGFISYVSQGDIFIAGADCSTALHTTENNGSYTSSGTTYNGFGIGNNQGIGGGEFFQDAGNTIPSETEGSQGALALMPGETSFMFTMMDVLGFTNAGTCKLSTVNGAKSNELILAGSTQYGKSNSMGDVEISGDVPYIQIGNRVWLDFDADGIQDPDENGIENVTIELFADFNKDSLPDGTALASTTTDAGGNYYFDISNVTDGDPSTVGNQPGLLAFKTYLLKIAGSDWNSSGVGINELLNHFVTIKDVGGAGQPDVRDNDAFLLNSVPTIIVDVEKNGHNDFNDDFGFNFCTNATLPEVTLNCTLDSALIGTIDVPGNTYSWQPPNGLVSTSSAQTLASPDANTTYTITINGNCIETITVRIDRELPAIAQGTTSSIDCATKNTIIGEPAQPGLSYRWVPSTGLSNDTIAQPIATPTRTTKYTLTVTGENGCSSKTEYTVEVTKCCTRLTLPSVFSPNGDNLNDTFGIIEIENVEKFKLIVYNRFGELVFQTESKDLRWDGNYKGKKCDVGTYFYLVQYECAVGGEKEQIKGDINLVR